jgi:hypothetical protein
LSNLIGRFANAAGALEGLSYLLTVVAGVGCLGYVAFTWVVHLISEGKCLVAGVSFFGVLFVSAFAAVRIPIALWLFFGSAAVLGTAFLMGAGNFVMP